MRHWLTAALAAGIVGLGSMAHAQGAAPPPAGSWESKVAAPGPTTTGVALDDQQTATVQKVNSYFNALDNLKGTFVQTSADKKKLKGKFFVKRPGKFRFDYSLPSKQIIISDGQYLAIQDLDLNNEDRIALDQTPFRLLLRKDVDLIRDARLAEVLEADDQIVIALQDKDPDSPGRIRLMLTTKPALELREWVTLDAQGLETRTEIADLDKTQDLDVAMFKIQPVGMPKSTP